MACRYAFALKAQNQGLTGASVTLRGGEHFDVLDGLKRGGGRIETDDRSLAAQLRRCPVLKEIRVARRSPRSAPGSRAARAKRPRTRRPRTTQPHEEA